MRRRRTIIANEVCVCVCVRGCVVVTQIRFELGWVGMSDSVWFELDDENQYPHICTAGSRRGHGLFFQRNRVCCCEAVDVDVGEDQSAVRIFGRVFASSSDDLYYYVYGRMVDGY